MKEELISFETAKLAKEKGFNCLVYAYYKNPTKQGKFPEGTLEYVIFQDYSESYEELLTNSNSLTPSYYQDKEYFSAPTQSLLQKWLREVHNILVFVGYCEDGYISQVWNKDDLEESEILDFDQYNIAKTYEKALEVGLQEGLRLINNN